MQSDVTDAVEAFREVLNDEELLEAELAKYQLILETLRGWLGSAEARVERDWRQILMKSLLLIFPKHVAILENVQIAKRALDIGSSVQAD